MSGNLILIAALSAAGVVVVAAVGLRKKARRRSAAPGSGYSPVLMPSEDPMLQQMRELTPQQFQRLCRLHSMLAEANPVSLEEWIAGFDADSEVERKIRIFEAVATTYSKAASTVILSTKDKQQLYEDLVMLSYDPDKPIVRRIRLPRGLPAWDTIVHWYRAALSGERLP